MLWTDRDADISLAATNSAPDLPTTSGELFSAAWARNNVYGQQYSGEADRFGVLDDYLKTIKQKGGPDLAPELDYGGTAPGAGGILSDSRSLFKQANDKLAAFKQNNPTFDFDPMTDEQFVEAGLDKRRQSDADYQALLARPRAGVSAEIGRAVGGVTSDLATPVNILALPIAPAEGIGLVAKAVQWGLIGLGTGAAKEALEAPYKEAAHPGYIASGQPLVNIAEAGLEVGLAVPIAHAAAKVIGYVGEPVLRRIARAFEGMAPSALPDSVKQAGDIVSSQANVLSSNIYPGTDGEIAHEQALPKAIDDILANRPVDVTQHITPELEARAAVPAAAVEAARTQAQAAAATAAQARAAAPPVAAPELPFARTAAEAAAEQAKETVSTGVQEIARRANYDMPADKATRIADKLHTATPEQAQTLLRNLQVSPRQVADAPLREERPAEPVPTPVSPVDVTSPDFHASVRADLDRELLQTAADFRAVGFTPEEAEALAAEHMQPYDFISEGGIPSRAASLEETGRYAPGISSSALMRPFGAVTQPAPFSQISVRNEPLGSLISRTTSPETVTGPRKTFSDFRLGAIDTPSNKHIVQGSNDLNALRAAAEQNKPLVDDRIERLVAEVPGTEFHGSRVKDLPGLIEKDHGLRPANSISDYLGARVIADTPEAFNAFARKIRDTGAVIEDEHFLSGVGKEGYRAEHIQLALDNGTSVELQLVPRPIAEVMDETHAIRQPVKRNDLTDPVQAAQYKEEMAKSLKIFNDVWDKASPEWHAAAERPSLATVDARPVPAELPEVHARYFKAAPGQQTTTVPIESLISSKTEADNAKGAPNAAKRMDASARGELDGRKLINVTPLPGGAFLVKDGNATFTAAKQYGWKNLPVHIEPEPGLQPIEHALPNGVATYTPDQLGVDAERFQFKAGADEAGVTERLRGVKNWDPLKAGMVLSWVDKDGKAWIVDGHQRLALARRIAAEDPTQHPQLLARTLKESDGITAQEARAHAAMKNIAEGTGTAIDAAKVIRDHPEMAADLPPRSELVRQARGLVNLSDDAFRMVVNEVVPANYAAIVGRLVPADPEMQTALLHLLAKTDPANAVQAEAIARQGIDAGLAKAEAGARASLFGDQDVAQSLYVERAKVLDRALKTLRRDKTVFGTLVKEQETLETAGNKLANEINQQRMTADGQALQILQTLANRAGPISDALRTAAGRAKSDGYPAATREFVETVRQAATSGDLARLADGLERGPSHVGDQSPAGTIDRGLAAEPVDHATAATTADKIQRMITEPGAEGLPQGIMPGMEQSARQLAAARAGALRPGVAQEAPGGLFAPPAEARGDMFPNIAADGRPVSLEGALRELDGLKTAADQIATCGAPAAEMAEAA